MEDYGVTYKKVKGCLQAVVGDIIVTTPPIPALSEFINGDVTDWRKQKWDRSRAYPTEEAIAAMKPGEQDALRAREATRLLDGGGAWLMLAGKPFYLTPDHYFFLTHFQLPELEHPTFYEADAKDYLWNVGVEQDVYCIGGVFMGARQRGKTARRAARKLRLAMTSPGKMLGIQSKTEDAARDVLNRFISHALRNMSDLIRPITNLATDDAQTKIEFKEPARRGKAAQNAPRLRALNSLIVRKNSKATAFDGVTLYELLSDEWAKKQDYDTEERLTVVSRMMWARDGRRKGRIWMYSTIDEKEDFEVEMPRRVWEGSDALQRLPNGRTKTGIVRLFMSCLEASVVDEFGRNDIPASLKLWNDNAPDKETDPIGYRRYCRANPRTPEDGFASGNKDSTFNLDALDDARDNNTSYFNQTGKYYWQTCNIVPDETDLAGLKRKIVPTTSGRFQIVREALPADLNAFGVTGTHTSILGTFPLVVPLNESRNVVGCLTPGELVMTDNGLKKVEEVVMSDRLIDNLGNLVNITYIHNDPVINEKTYRIKVGNTLRTTNFTSEHPIFSYSPALNSKKAKKESNFDFSFRKANEIAVGDWIKFPNVYKKVSSDDISFHWNDLGIKDQRIIDNPLQQEDFWWLVGLWLGDGWCESNEQRVSFAFNLSETCYIDRFKRIVQSVFGRPVLERKHKVNKCTELAFDCKKLSYFLSKHFGKYAHGKAVPEWLKYSETKYKQAFLAGYLASDGCITKHPKGYLSTEFVSVNLELLEAVQDVCFSLGIISNLSQLRGAQVHVMSHGGSSNTRVCYHLRFGHNDTRELAAQLSSVNEDSKLQKVDLDSESEFGERKTKGCFFDAAKENIYFQVSAITEGSYTGMVYNFATETHTFMCHHINTHNCDPYNARRVRDLGAASRAAAYCFWKPDELHEREKFIPGTNVERPGYWPSDSFFIQYLIRPATPHVFFEDMISLCLITGAPILIENNKDALLAHFEDRGMAAFMATNTSIVASINAKIDQKQRKSKKGETFGVAASANAQGGTTEQWAERISAYTHGPLILDRRRMPFNEQIGSIVTLNLADTKKYDAAVATGWTMLLARRFRKVNPPPPPRESYRLSELFEEGM